MKSNEMIFLVSVESHERIFQTATQRLNSMLVAIKPIRVILERALHIDSYPETEPFYISRRPTEKVTPHAPRRGFFPIAPSKRMEFVFRRLFILG
jgi:hypothetical protein